MNRHLLTGLCAALILALPGAFAQSPLPTAFLYQGKLSDAGQPAAGLHAFEFALYGMEAGGSALGTLAKDDVPVTGGIFHVDLDFGAGAFDGQARWLEIRVRRSDATILTTLSPRQPLLPAPHALYATRAGTVPDGSITGSKFAPGSVGPAALATGAVTGDKIALGTIDSAQLKDGSVSAAKLAPGAVGPEQLSKSYRAGSVSITDLPNDFVPRFAVNFSSAMSEAPAVVTGFKDTFSENMEGALVQLTEATPAGFVARALLPGTYALTGISDADSPMYGDGLATAEVNGRAGALYSFDAPSEHGVRYFGRSAGGNAYFGEVDTDFFARECALATMNGMAMGAYIGEDTPGNAATQRLRFAQATNANGTAWTVVSTFGNASAAPWASLSLQNVADRPAIAYLESAGGGRFVRYRRAGVDLANWPVSTLIFSDPGITAISNLLVVNGRPAIAWVQSGRVRYSRAADINGSTWQAPVYLSSAGADGLLVMAIIAGRPALAFHHDGTRYTRALDADGAAWPADGVTANELPLDSPGLIEDAAGRPCIGGTSPYWHTNRNILMLTSEADNQPWTRWLLRTRLDDATAPVVFGNHGAAAATSVCYYYSNDPDGRRRLYNLTPNNAPGSVSWIAVEP